MGKLVPNLSTNDSSFGRGEVAAGCSPDLALYGPLQDGSLLPPWPGPVCSPPVRVFKPLFMLTTWCAPGFAKCRVERRGEEVASLRR